MHAAYEYGLRGDMPPVKLNWYQGEEKPELWQKGAIPKWNDGVLFVGGKGMLLADYGRTCSCLKRTSATSSVPSHSFPSRSAITPSGSTPARPVTDDLQLRVRRLADRGQPPRERGLPHRQEARVGRRQAIRHNAAGGRAVHPPRLSQRLDVELVRIAAQRFRDIVVRTNAWFVMFNFRTPESSTYYL